MTNVYQLEKGTVKHLRLTLAAGVIHTIALPGRTRAVVLRTALTDVVVATEEDPAAISTSSANTVAASAFGIGTLLNGNNSENIIAIIETNSSNLKLRSTTGGVVDIVAIESHQESNIVF